ncbi:MAG: hypothetical protein QXD64_08740 [Thermoplasmata archaeon]
MVDILQDGVRFEWDTTVPTAENTVRVWNGGYDRTFAEVDPAIEKTHHISPIFSGLQKNMVYNYRITANTVTFYSTFPLPDLYIYDVVVSATENSATITWKTNINTDTTLWWKIYKPDWDGYGWSLSSKAESTKDHTVVLQHLNPAENYDYYIVATTVVDGQTYTASYGSREQPHSFTTETAITVLQVEDYYEPARDENGVRVWWETGDDGEHTYRVEVIKEGIPKYMMEVSEQGKCHMVEIPVGQKVIPNTTYDFKVTVIDVGIEKTIENIKASEDYDGDGLSDAEEKTGWDVPQIHMYAPWSYTYYDSRQGGHVSSDPGDSDADHDGWKDSVEKEHRTKPSPAAPPIGGGGGGGKPPLICGAMDASLGYDPNTLPYVDGKDTDGDGVNDPDDYKTYSEWNNRVVCSPLSAEPRRAALIVAPLEQNGGTPYGSETGNKWKEFFMALGWHTVLLTSATDTTVQQVKDKINEAIMRIHTDNNFDLEIFALIIISHGYEKEDRTDGYVSLSNGILYASDLRTQTLLSEYRGHLFCVIDACYSGYFAKKLTEGYNPECGRWVIMTAANLHTSTIWVSTEDGNYHAFSYVLLVKGFIGKGKNEVFHPQNPNYDFKNIWNTADSTIRACVESYFMYVNGRTNIPSIDSVYWGVLQGQINQYPWPLCGDCPSPISPIFWCGDSGALIGEKMFYGMPVLYLWWDVK